MTLSPIGSPLNVSSLGSSTSSALREPSQREDTWRHPTRSPLLNPNARMSSPTVVQDDRASSVWGSPVGVLDGSGANSSFFHATKSRTSISRSDTKELILRHAYWNDVTQKTANEMKASEVAMCEFLFDHEQDPHGAGGEAHHAHAQGEEEGETTSSADHSRPKQQSNPLFDLRTWTSALRAAMKRPTVAPIEATLRPSPVLAECTSPASSLDDGQDAVRCQNPAVLQTRATPGGNGASSVNVVQNAVREFRPGTLRNRLACVHENNNIRGGLHRYTSLHKGKVFSPRSGATPHAHDLTDPDPTGNTGEVNHKKNIGTGEVKKPVVEEDVAQREQVGADAVIRSTQFQQNTGPLSNSSGVGGGRKLPPLAVRPPSLLPRVEGAGGYPDLPIVHHALASTSHVGSLDMEYHPASRFRTVRSSGDGIQLGAVEPSSAFSHSGKKLAALPPSIAANRTHAPPMMCGELIKDRFLTTYADAENTSSKSRGTTHSTDYTQLYAEQKCLHDAANAHRKLYDKSLSLLEEHNERIQRRLSAYIASPSNDKNTV